MYLISVDKYHWMGGVHCMTQPIGQCLNNIHTLYTLHVKTKEFTLTFLIDAHLLRLSVAMATLSEPHSIL